MNNNLTMNITDAIEALKKIFWIKPDVIWTMLMSFFHLVLQSVKIMI